MADNNSSTTGGIGLTSIVFLVFLVLKLANIGVVATWSWWWVFSPLWITAIIVILFLAAVCVWAIFSK